MLRQKVITFMFANSWTGVRFNPSAITNNWPDKYAIMIIRGKYLISSIGFLTDDVPRLPGK